MKKLIYLVIAIAILGLIVPGCIPMVPPTEQDNLNTFTKSNGLEVWVDDDFDSSTNGWGTTHFNEIQDGVDAVTDYGTVHVANGMYNATTANSQQHSTNSDWWFFVIIDKSLNLIGESQDGVILDGTLLSQDIINVTRPTCIWISTSNVTVENLTIRNFHNIVDYSQYSYGVVSWKDLRNWGAHNPADTISNITLDNLKVQDCLASIYFMHTEYPTVKNCIVKDGLADGIWIAMGGINAVVQGNTVINSDDHGIWVGGAGWCGPSCDNAIITDNYVDGAREGGISFVASTGATISGNTITNVAGEGWSVGALSLKDGPSNVEAFNNTIYGNDGNWSGYSGTGHGIGIDGTPSNIYINCNEIYDNTGYGIYNYSVVQIDATNNWWGHASGPNGEGPGTGDEVSSYVVFDPWLSDTDTLVIDDVTVPNNLVEQGTFTDLIATFTGPTGGTATIDWGDGSTDTVDKAEGTVTVSHAYAEAGVYTVTFTITDYCERLSDTKEFQYVVVYDPSAGFVTGGGWIDSPPGAYIPDKSLTGPANFGFVSKYKKGQTTPTGNTEFQFKAGDLNFHSSSYDWLVIAGHKAMYKGIGTINGDGNFGFMLSAIDEKITPSTDVDLFRIKIWDKNNGDALVYDNNDGQDDDADPTTGIAGGQIVIHKAK